MRHLAIIFALPCLAAAQTADGEKVTQALIAEIQQLRLAIERSTLLGARAQLTIGQLQMEENAVARASSQLNEIKMQGASAAANRARLAASLQGIDQQRNDPQNSTGPRKEQIEDMARQIKVETEQANAFEIGRSAREGELTTQLQTAQAQVNDARSRIAEMERALDNAIEQLLKPKK